jgi:hypothetical protein
MNDAVWAVLLGGCAVIVFVLFYVRHRYYRSLEEHRKEHDASARHA